LIIFSNLLLKAVKNHSSNIHTGVITVLPFTNLNDHLKYLDSVTIGWDKKSGWLWSVFRSRLEKIIKKIRENNIKLYGGHVYGEKDVFWLMDRKFDGIWTDNVRATTSWIDFYNLGKEKKNGKA